MPMYRRSKELKRLTMIEVVVDDLAFVEADAILAQPTIPSLHSPRR